MAQDSASNKMSDCRMDDRVSGVGSFIFFTSLSKPTSGLHNSFSEVKWLKDEPDKSPPSTSMVSNACELVSTPLYDSWTRCLSKGTTMNLFHSIRFRVSRKQNFSNSFSICRIHLMFCSINGDITPLTTAKDCKYVVHRGNKQQITY
jgi:hypothetical protein